MRPMEMVSPKDDWQLLALRHTSCLAILIHTLCTLLACRVKRQ